MPTRVRVRPSDRFGERSPRQLSETVVSPRSSTVACDCGQVSVQKMKNISPTGLQCHRICYEKITSLVSVQKIKKISPGSS
ncbi:hypothetical protein J6590_021149 [Homalodisca vitripennis]|nr:hypothetical protein J6590_021149 [Homalodisca vitripennis]